MSLLETNIHIRSPVDMDLKTWTCPFCFQGNQFPSQYAGMTAENLPAELIPDITSIEYASPSQPLGIFPKYLFVLDVCVSQEELDSLKETLLKTLDLIPKTSSVGLITFGSTVQVYDLGFTLCARSHVFHSDKDLDSAAIQAILKSHYGEENQPSPFILPLTECEENFRVLLQELSVDPRLVKNNMRPLRKTGLAVSVGLRLLELLCPNQGARLMLMMGGPCTGGLGMVVSEELKETIRSHHELNKETAKHFSAASKFYSALAKIAATNGHAVDLFSCSCDQTGLLEMRALAKETGGLVVLADGFKVEVFQHSLYKIFEKDDHDQLQFGLNATIEVIASSELRIMGAIGHMASMGTKNSRVSDKELGLGKTSSWKMCALDRNSSYAFFLEVVNQHATIIPPTRYGMVQFQTTYQHTNGYRVLKVTTVAHAWCQPSLGHKALLPGFDQEAAAALMARIAVFKNEKDDTNAIRWIDRSLIQLYNAFCDFHKGMPETLEIPQQMNVYHQFMFYLRRGPLIQVFNSSPDETVFFRFCLQRESVSNVLVMIQPTLDSYTLDNDPMPVPLSATSISKTSVLLLDTFFHVVVHFGKTIAEWRDSGYHENPEYENVKDLIEYPVLDAQELLAMRLPLPMYVECDEDTSQARFIVATLDPSITHNDRGLNQGQVIYTEDVNLKVFVEFLKKRVTEYES